MTAKPLNQISGMPQIGAAFSGWQQTITLLKITQAVVNGLVQDTGASMAFKGTIQPLSPKMIALKPEGQRAWEWLQIHCFAQPANLTTNDRFIYAGKTYKIMAANDYSLSNYIEFHAVADYGGTL